MVSEETEILFPGRLIPELRGLRGGEWNQLVERAARAEETGQESLSFILMMVRICGCTNCSTDSFRGMRGCSQCAKQSLKRFRGDDEELIRLYHEASQEVIQFLTATKSTE
jgi:hypothetical protein